MKRLIYFSAACFISLLWSCTDNDELGSSIDVDLSSEASIESSFEEVDLISEAGMESINSTGRGVRDAILECATVTRDTINKTMTIDYGAGCTGPYGRIRSGKIHIAYSDHRYVSGATRTVTLEDFKVDSVLIEGTRTITNITESTTANPAFSVVLEGGRVTFTDGTFITRTSNTTRTWIRGENPVGDTVVLTGSASGLTRAGNDYTMNIDEPLTFMRACRVVGVIIPVKGVKSFNSQESSIVIDYGDGECDHLVTITRNGISTEETLTPRGRTFRRG